MRDGSDIRALEDGPGFHLWEDAEVIVEVRLMMFNWRLVCTRVEERGIFIAHGYCYFGRDERTLQRAIEAGLAWEDPLHTPPAGFDKHAF